MTYSLLLLIPVLMGAEAGGPEIDAAALLDEMGYARAAPPAGVQWDSDAHAQSVALLVAGREAHLHGNLQESYERYVESVEADPTNEAAWRGLARVARDAGDAALERRAWLQRLELVPDDIEALAVAAEAALLSGRDTEALQLILRREAAEPRDEAPHERIRWDLALAERLPILGKDALAARIRADAQRRLMQLATEDEGDGKARNRWAWMLQRLAVEGGREEARQAAESRLLSGKLHNRGDVGRFTSTCVVLDALDRDAARTLQLIRSLPPDNLRLRLRFREHLTPAEMILNASIVHASLGNEEGAIDLLEEVMQLDDAPPMAANNLGYMLLEGGADADRAAKLIEHAAARAPEDPAMLDSLGVLRLGQDRVDDGIYGRGALSLLREAARRTDQADPIILQHLGDAEEAAGHGDAARRTWRHALSLLEHPGFRAEKIRVWDVVQSGDWGIRVTPSADLYDLEFKGIADQLRSRLGGEGETTAPPG
ncbi:MAG: hypothetical protein QF733_04150 [Phycisphaerales bacterium]|nr:hypothetical protein [Phycisphaerales bacterium]